MSELVLYRKYRPQNFGEVVGQEHVVGALKNALRQGKIAHAYLFSGPRGVGKTTIARLIAKSLNCEGSEKPCNSCSSCQDFLDGRAMDLIEIDAASNRGIDEIRALREGVRFVPSQGKYKTYVIDECHSLTKDAFNALLKTLEEPPPHVVFVLATTELEKVPATIISRTQHYDFRRPSVKQIAGRLTRIAEKERVRLEEDAAQVIALTAEGSLRDAESILGQILAIEDKKITRHIVEATLGLPPREAAKKMWEFIAKKDAPAALALVQEVHDAGHDLSHFSKILLHYFRNALFLKTDASLKQFIEHEMLPDEFEAISAHLPAFSHNDLSRGLKVIFENLQSFRHAPIPQLPLEVTIIELIQNQKLDSKSQEA
jgi:DNA polymerase III subunit gamma/tau